MNNEIRREQRLWGRLLVIAMLVACAGVLIIALSVAGVLGYTPQPVSDPVEPDPWIIGNITKDAHKSSWSLVQYEDDYGDVRTLPGFTANTIYLNYSEIHGHENYLLGGVNWSDPTKWTQGSCTLQNPSVSLTQEGIVFYAEPWYDFTPQSCSWKLDVVDFEINSQKDRWNVGIYFDKIGGYGQFSRLRLEDPSNQPKEYEANPFATVPSEGTMAMRLANENRTAVFESQVVSEIGWMNEEISEVDEFWVWFNANEPWTAGCYEKMRMVLYFMEIETKTYNVGYTTAGQKVRTQTQADNNAVELGSFSVGFDYTTIDNLKVGYKQRASDLSDAYVEVSRSQYLSTYRFNYPQPEATSLSYDDAVLRDKLNQAGNVFTEVKLNGQEITYRYGPLSENDEIVLLEGIQEGEQPTLYYETSYSSGEWDGITKGDGGWWALGGITPQMVAPFVALGILVAILAVALIQKWKRSREERPAGEEKPSVRGLANDEKAILMEGREILHWLIIGAIVVFIVFTVLAMLRSIPIVWGWIGPVGLSALLPSLGVYSTWNNEALAEGLAKSTTGFQLDFISDTLDAFVQGLIDVFNALVNAIVHVINTIGAVIGTFIELIILPPARFVGGAFDAATATLTGLGISAPLAMIIVTVSVGVVIATVGVFVYKQLTGWED